MSACYTETKKSLSESLFGVAYKFHGTTITTYHISIKSFANSIESLYSIHMTRKLRQYENNLVGRVYSKVPEQRHLS